jgi:hypothetical protein
MPARRWLYVAFGMVSLLLLSGIFARGTNEVGAHVGPPLPTLAATRTPGPPVTDQPFIYPTLVQPLDTED